MAVVPVVLVLWFLFLLKMKTMMKNSSRRKQQTQTDISTLLLLISADRHTGSQSDRQADSQQYVINILFDIFQKHQGQN